MKVPEPLQQVQFDLWAQAASYKSFIEAATIALLSYIGYADFRDLKIRNESLVLLLALYCLYALPQRSAINILFDVLYAIIVFGFLLVPYARRLIGGGDVKLLAVACLWTGTHCALVFSGALLVFIVLHLAALRTHSIVARNGNNVQLMPYGPSVAAALISALLLGCI
jgi:prepilin peptidase CpaA